MQLHTYFHVHYHLIIREKKIPLRETHSVNGPTSVAKDFHARPRKIRWQGAQFFPSPLVSMRKQSAARRGSC